MGLLVKDKEIVTPGEDLAVGLEYLPSYGTYRDGERIVASKLGLVSADNRIIKLIPLSGKYMPKNGDVIIGKVVDIMLNGWRIDINSAYSAMLSVKDASSEFIQRGADLTKYFNFGDYIMTQIINVTSQNLIDVSMKGPGLRKLGEGRIIHVNTYKVPRIIGKQGSMVTMVKDATDCRISVGQNGVVWIQGEPEKEMIAVEAICKIEEESHISGLTERIKEFLEKRLK